MEIESLSQPIEDLHIIDLLKEFRQRILAIFRVPPIVYGVVEGVNLETSRNQMITFSQYIKSIQRIISAGATQAIRRILRLEGFHIKLHEWMNPEQETRIHVLRVGSGIETVNEARAFLGLPPIEEKRGGAGNQGELLRESVKEFPV